METQNICCVMDHPIIQRQGRNLITTLLNGSERIIDNLQFLNAFFRICLFLFIRDSYCKINMELFRGAE